MNSQKLCRALIALAVCLGTAMRGMNQAPTPAVAQAATQENPGFFKRWSQYFSRPKVWTITPDPLSIYHTKNNNCGLYNAYINEQKAGFLKTFHYRSRTTLINRLIIENDFRFQGIGSLLFQKALDDARNERCKIVRWDAKPIAGSLWTNEQLDAWYVKQIKKWATQNYADVAKVEIIGPIGHEFQIKLTYPEECVDGGY